MNGYYSMSKLSSGSVFQMITLELMKPKISEALHVTFLIYC